MTRRLFIALLCIAVAGAQASAQQEVPPEKAPVAAAARADLSKLAELERSYFAINKRFTADVKSLQFTPASGAVIAVSYASARTFSASASDVRLAPFLCFVIVGADAGSPAEKPFCTDSRYGTAASALARAGTPVDTPAAPDGRGPGAPSARTGGARGGGRGTRRAAATLPAPDTATVVLTPAAFEERLREAAHGARDSTVVVVQFAVTDARFDPSRGVVEVRIDRVLLPVAEAQASAAGAARPALACFTHPAFVCGTSGLTYIARDLLRVSPAKAPDPETLRSGLALQARFAIGRRDDTPEPALTLLTLVLKSRGDVVARWERAPDH